jgi:hypothetical protein
MNDLSPGQARSHAVQREPSPHAVRMESFAHAIPREPSAHVILREPTATEGSVPLTEARILRCAQDAMGLEQ